YKHYRNEKSPLSNVLLKNKDFFDLFVNFQRYVNFFCLDDLVDNGQVRDLMHNGCYINDKSFDEPFPKDPKEYFQWMENQLDFVQKRTKRINQTAIGKH
nr:hypothetical protein [Alphaproteobacteria bacterium]